MSTSAVTTPSAMVLPPAGADAVAVVRLASPWYAPNWLIARTFRRYVGEYEPLQALQRKLYTLSTDRYYGGIYLWTTMESMRAYFSPRWIQRARERRGTEPHVRLWQAPYILQGNATLGGQSFSERSLYGSRAAATLTLFGTGHSESALAKLAEVHGMPEGLAWAALLRNDEGQIGLLDVWASAAHALASSKMNWLNAAERALGHWTQEFYRVPVWMKPREK